MKKLLLAGAAATAVALTAGAASAQSKFEVRVGGDALFIAGFTSQKKDTNLRSVEFLDRVRLNTVATGKADNGIEYGVRLRLTSDAGTGGSNAVRSDRAYIFVGGSFGTLTMGTQNGVSDEYATLGPLVDIGGGTLGQTDGFWSGFIGGTSSLLPTTVATGSLRAALSSNAYSRISYVSPTFGGFKLAGSYTPNTSDSGFSVNRAKNNGSVQDLYEVGALYSGDFSGFTVDGNVFYSGADVQATNTRNVSAWFAGLTLGYNGFKLGGSYTNMGKSGYVKSLRYDHDQESFIVAGSYTTGPITLGVSYTNGKGTQTAGTKADLDLTQAAINYVVAPGLTTGIEYSHFELDTGSSATKDKGDVVLLQTTVVF